MAFPKDLSSIRTNIALDQLSLIKSRIEQGNVIFYDQDLFTLEVPWCTAKFRYNGGIYFIREVNELVEEITLIGFERGE